MYSNLQEVVEIIDGESSLMMEQADCEEEEKKEKKGEKKVGFREDKDKFKDKSHRKQLQTVSKNHIFSTEGALLVYYVSMLVSVQKYTDALKVIE